MKVLIATDWYAPAVNGVVTSVLNLKRELAARGHEVRVLTLSQTPHSRREGDVTYIGAVSAGMIYPGARLRTAPAMKLLGELEAWKPDIIHTQCEFSTFVMAKRLAAATGAPIVHTYHTVYEDYTHYFSPSQRWGRAAVASFTRWAVSHTECVIAPTAKVRRILERYQVDRPVHVIPTGIDLSRFDSPADETHLTELRRQLGIAASDKVLVYVGRLAEEKNIGQLLDKRLELVQASELKQTSLTEMSALDIAIGSFDKLGDPGEDTEARELGELATLYLSKIDTRKNEIVAIAEDGTVSVLDGSKITQLYFFRHRRNPLMLLTDWYSI